MSTKIWFILHRGRPDSAAGERLLSNSHKQPSDFNFGWTSQQCNQIAAKKHLKFGEGIAEQLALLDVIYPQQLARLQPVYCWSDTQGNKAVSMQ